MTSATMSDAVYGYARSALRPEHLWHWTIFIVVSLAVATPLIFLVLGSFSEASLPTQFTLSELTLRNYRQVWLDPDTYLVFYNTLIYVTGATAFGISVAAGLAWLVERTDIPGKLWIYAGVPMTLAMPGMLQAMAYVLLLSPRIGYLNEVSRRVWARPHQHLLPWRHDLHRGATSRADGFPDAGAIAALHGPGPRGGGLHVGCQSAPDVTADNHQADAAGPARGFDLPVHDRARGVRGARHLGLPASIYVFSTKIYSILHSSSSIPAYGQANALAMIYVVIAIAATWIYAKVISKSERFSIITGKGYRPRVTELGRGRWLALGLVLLFLAFSIILPSLVLCYVSFLPFLQSPSVAAFRMMTVDHYVELWQTPLIGQVMMEYFIHGSYYFHADCCHLFSGIAGYCSFQVLGTADPRPDGLSCRMPFLGSLSVSPSFGCSCRRTKYGINLYGGVWSDLDRVCCGLPGLRHALHECGHPADT